MQSLKQIKKRIRTTESVKKVTKAMETISAIKLKPFEKQIFSSTQYFQKLDLFLKNLLGSIENPDHPLINKSPRLPAEKTALCVITSDTGLCGMYNNNVLHLAETFINKTGRDKILLFAVGKKGFNYFSKKGLIAQHAYAEMRGHYSEEILSEILKDITDLYTKREIDEVYMIYTLFETASRFRPVSEKFLNIECTAESKTDYIFEPDAKDILDKLIPVYLSNKLKLIFLNSLASEHSSRTIAMGEATENARGLLQNLVLWRNKIRQEIITTDLTEISSAVEAMK